MTTSAKLAGLVLFSGLAFFHGAAPSAADEAKVFRVTPSQGITLTVGAKRAVGYYTVGDNACNLTLLLADAYSETSTIVSESVRVNMAVRAGQSARVDTLAGPALAFRCEPSAAAMTIQPVDQVAYINANAVAK